MNISEKTTVYILSQWRGCDISHIVGVFSSKELGNKHIEEHREKNPHYDGIEFSNLPWIIDKPNDIV